eukprot:5687664-Lingulodinium_polyedra.AAC.1
MWSPRVPCSRPAADTGGGRFTVQLRTDRGKKNDCTPHPHRLTTTLAHRALVHARRGHLLGMSLAKQE